MNNNREAENQLYQAEPTQSTLSQERKTFFTHTRHDLRTPINHLIGYGELLLEEAEEAGLSSFVISLQAICKTSRQVLLLINAAFDHSTGDISKTQIEQLRTNTPELLDQLSEVSNLLLSEARERGYNTYLSSLQKIHNAAKQLSELINKFLASAVCEEISTK